MSPKRGNKWRCQTQPGGCPCTCHQRAEQRKRRTHQLATRWQPEHDAIVRQGIERGDTLRQIADSIEHDHQIRRPIGSIRNRITELGLSRRDGWRSQAEVARMLGVAEVTVYGWRERGHLAFEEHGRWYRVRDAALEAFIREQAGRLFDPLKVKDPKLRSLAEVSARANRVRSA